MQGGTRRGSRALRTLLTDLGDMVTRECVKSPALIVIGDVAALGKAEDVLARAEAIPAFQEAE
jgi:uroporphyrin-III C-methyltransferase